MRPTSELCVWVKNIFPRSDYFEMPGLECSYSGGLAGQGLGETKVERNNWKGSWKTWWSNGLTHALYTGFSPPPCASTSASATCMATCSVHASLEIHASVHLSQSYHDRDTCPSRLGQLILRFSDTKLSSSRALCSGAQTRLSLAWNRHSRAWETKYPYSSSSTRECPFCSVIPPGTRLLIHFPGLPTQELG